MIRDVRLPSEGSDVHRRVAGAVHVLSIIVGNYHRHGRHFRSGGDDLGRVSLVVLLVTCPASARLRPVDHAIRRGEARLERRLRQLRGPLALGAVNIAAGVRARPIGVAVLPGWVTGQLSLIVFVALRHLLRQIAEVQDETLGRILEICTRVTRLSVSRKFTNFLSSCLAFEQARQSMIIRCNDYLQVEHKLNLSFNYLILLYYN